jgi:hypothetical protein
MYLTWDAIPTSMNGGDAITFYAIEFSVGKSPY